ncbi:MAG: pilus assembly protein PilZ [Myxococcales bacterium]|nr:pilus assembly protein PilZ [Myxococcales bacterium]
MPERRKTDPRAIRPEKRERRLGDRRDSHRLPIEVEVAEGNGPFEKHQGDISIGGVFFKKPLSLPIGAQVQLRFTLPGLERTIDVRGEVVEVTNAGGTFTAGTRVRFSDLDVRAELLIARYLDQNRQG